MVKRPDAEPPADISGIKMVEIRDPGPGLSLGLVTMAGALIALVLVIALWFQ